LLRPGRTGEKAGKRTENKMGKKRGRGNISIRKPRGKIECGEGGIKPFLGEAGPNKDTQTLLKRGTTLKD